MAPDHAGCRAPEQALGGGIPSRDHTVQLLRDNGVIGRIHDGRKPQGFLLSPPALGNIAADSRGSHDISSRVANGRDSSVDFKHAAIPASSHRLTLNARLHLLAALDRAP